MGNLTGKRVFVVEDEALLALMITDMLADAGAVVVGPATTIEQGLAIASSAAIDLAMLDVNVRGSRIDPVVDVLDRRGIPYILATGYSDRPPQLRSTTKIVRKPYVEDLLISSLSSLLDAGCDSKPVSG